MLNVKNYPIEIKRIQNQWRASVIHQNFLEASGKNAGEAVQNLSKLIEEYDNERKTLLDTKSNASLHMKGFLRRNRPIYRYQRMSK